MTDDHAGRHRAQALALLKAIDGERWAWDAMSDPARAKGRQLEHVEAALAAAEAPLPLDLLARCVGYCRVTAHSERLNAAGSYEAEAQARRDADAIERAIRARGQEVPRGE